MLTKSQFNGKLASVSKNSSTIRDDIQELLITAAFYAFRDNNAATFQQIIEAVGDGTRKAGITAWAETFAPVRVVKGLIVMCKKTMAEYDVKTEEAYADLLAETGAATTLWYTSVKKEVSHSVFDPTNYMDGVLKKLNREGMPDLANFVSQSLRAYALETALLKRSEKVETVE